MSVQHAPSRAPGSSTAAQEFVDRREGHLTSDMAWAGEKSEGPWQGQGLCLKASCVGGLGLQRPCGRWLDPGDRASGLPLGGRGRRGSGAPGAPETAMGYVWTTPKASLPEGGA